MQHFLPIVMKRSIALTLSIFTSTAILAGPVLREPIASGSARVREAANKICPVSGDPVASVGKPVYDSYCGKPVGLCCKECAKRFRKHADKYGPLAEKNQAALEPM
jgi:hypothetical protein